ncbi:MAG: transporter substrate-binding domain-containing protein [Anaerovorax sp.]|nr:transporter substrate-binding domain-containing protein [Anaerovorax sp.]
MNKKKLIVPLVLIAILSAVCINEYLELKYSISWLQYIQYSSNYTKKEIEILHKYQPLIYGGNINEPPLGNYYKENGQYIGLVVDYSNALSIELEIPIISEPMIWNQALESLKKGETNLCDMVPSKEREKYFAFSNPIYKLRGIIVVQNDDITKLNDLNGKKVAVQKGDYALECIDDEKIKLIYTDNLGEALNLLFSESVDAVIGDEPVIRYFLNGLNFVNNYHVLEKPLYETSCCFAVPKKQKELIPIINKAIFTMEANGTLDKIEEKWSGHYTAFLDHRQLANKIYLTLLAMITIMLSIGYVVYLWNRSLKLSVEERTKELNLMKNELQTTFDGIDDFLVVIDQNLIIKNINISFAKYQKISKHELIYSPYTKLDLLCDFDKQYPFILSGLLNDDMVLENFDVSVKYELKNRNRFYKATLFPLEKGPTGERSILIMISDLTKARIEEQKLIHSNKMETIGELAAGVAHELRTPLGSIRNSAFILKKEEEKVNEGNEIKTMALNAIDNSVNRASNIIDNLLKFSRLTHDEKLWINVYQSITDSIELHKKLIREHEIELTIECEKMIKLFTNEAALQHILMNLIQNAIDSMQNGGALSILCYKEQELVIIKVKDSGTGIEEDKIERIFDPFYTTKPVGKGTGLGLYIAYSEVKKIGGEIKVMSEVGKGTEFYVMIPDGGDKYDTKIKTINSR